MSNVIQFLESMGANAAMARMSAADFEAVVAGLVEEEDCRAALMRRDTRALNDLLNGRDVMMCMVFAPDEKEGDETPGEEREDEKTPDDKSLE